MFVPRPLWVGLWRILEVSFEHTAFLYVPEGAGRGLPELLVHLLSCWQLCCFTNDPVNRSRSKKARDWRGLGSGAGPEVQWGLPMYQVGQQGAYRQGGRCWALLCPVLSAAWAENGGSRPGHLPPWLAVPWLSRAHRGSLASGASAPARWTDSSWVTSSLQAYCLFLAWGFFWSLQSLLSAQPGLREGVPQAPDRGDQCPASCPPRVQPLVSQRHTEPRCPDGHQWAHPDHLLPPPEQLQVTSLHPDSRPSQPGDLI